jgi:hypothetical protein
MDSGTNTRSGKWTDAFLDQMRATADPVADDVVGALFKANGVQAVNSLWDAALKNDELRASDFPEPVSSYLRKSAELPSWANRDLVLQGEQFFVRRGIFCLISLLCASLPECYVLKNEAAVLGTARNLENHAFRRIFETTQLIVSVMAEGGILGNEPRGIMCAQKVRLMHAAIRHLVMNVPRVGSAGAAPKSLFEAIQQTGIWDTSKLGLPINQEEMAYTLLTFSYVTLRTFKRMRIEVSPAEAEAYLHCWNIVGFVMGVREDMMAQTFEEAEALFLKIKSRQIGQSKDGEALANGLVNATQKIIELETGGLVARSIAKRFPFIIMHLVLDKETIRVLKVRRLTICEWLGLNLLRMSAAVFTRLYLWFISVWGARFGQLVVDEITRIPRGWNRKLFDLPQTLRVAWRIKA